MAISGKPEDQTSFYLWKYETDKTSGEKSTLYYTKVPDKLDEEGNVITAGYYGWVEYKPENKTLSYTITTTNGKLNIDYALLENMVYYLQEAVAPDGYDIDTTDVCHLRRRYLQPAQGVRRNDHQCGRRYYFFRCRPRLQGCH